VKDEPGKRGSGILADTKKGQEKKGIGKSMYEGKKNLTQTGKENDEKVKEKISEYGGGQGRGKLKVI